MRREALACMATVALGCGAVGSMTPGELAWVDGRHAQLPSGRGAFEVRWSQRLVPMFDDAYVPVETATPAVDPERDRVYVGSTTGALLAMRGNGRHLYRYEAGASLEAGPTLDADKQELYVVSEDGVVHALRASDGSVRWKVDSGVGATRQSAVLLADAVYVVSETDNVVALSRDQGEVLWRYKREPTDGYHVVGHAGLMLDRGRVFAAFSDGAVAALDASDGRALWVRETGLDFPPGEAGRGQRFVDVDTTPVLVDGLVYAASFSGGLYALDARSGSVVANLPALTGITSIVGVHGDLVITKSDGVIERIHADTGEAIWSRKASRGTASMPLLAGDVLYFSETRGGFVARSVASGAELSRLEATHGFSAVPVVAEQRGFIVSNGGRLYAFTAAGN